MLIRQRHDLYHIGTKTIQMRHHDHAGSRSDAGLNCLSRHYSGIGIDICPHHGGTGLYKRIGTRSVGMGRYNHLITRFEPAKLGSYLQRCGGTANGKSVLNASITAKTGLELMQASALSEWRLTVHQRNYGRDFFFGIFVPPNAKGNSKIHITYSRILP